MYPAVLNTYSTHAQKTFSTVSGYGRLKSRNLQQQGVSTDDWRDPSRHWGRVTTWVEHGSGKRFRHSGRCLWNVVGWYNTALWLRELCRTVGSAVLAAYCWRITDSSAEKPVVEAHLRLHENVQQCNSWRSKQDRISQRYLEKYRAALARTMDARTVEDRKGKRTRINKRTPIKELKQTWRLKRLPHNSMNGVFLGSSTHIRDQFLLSHDRRSP
jgi:hypothetical protein